MGLINGAFAGGAAQGVSDIGKQMTSYGMNEQISKREMQAKEAMQIAAEARAGKVRGDERTQDRADKGVELKEQRLYDEGQDKVKHDRSLGLISQTAKAKAKEDVAADPGKEYKNEKIKGLVKELKYWEAMKLSPMEDGSRGADEKIKTIKNELDALTNSGSETYSVSDETDEDGVTRRVSKVSGKGSLPSGGKPSVTREQVKAAAAKKGIADPTKLEELYAGYGV